ncbi:hypothetical protein YPC_2754 [Yersinia pestis biovar Medievalis str. Harbin 35]|nr:hypothetical protein YPC_2754 [Yersinia pestis biovar Medievalis str. Harbin 35]EEO75003.1 hypothetical protein YP516_2887 [Yersinia pestis Nepal516]EEO81898.1 hypothetical protein YPF_1876 [Yersinia pestis biovar Orientalis str. India 195]EEO87798.1 hypothetical protein YPH_3768 [Yersinia pestis biovar Orientalis str. PEXU2]EEO88816.1 hypothetical protein YPS_3666 [Yersinia pestis Pestoides A]
MLQNVKLRELCDLDRILKNDKSQQSWLLFVQIDVIF